MPRSRLCQSGQRPAAQAQAAPLIEQREKIYDSLLKAKQKWLDFQSGKLKETFHIKGSYGQIIKIIDQSKELAEGDYQRLLKEFQKNTKTLLNKPVL